MLPHATAHIVVFLVATLVAVFPAHAQDETIRIDTTLVTIPTAVMDRDGHYILNLSKEDFEIFEDGVSQEIALFQPVNEPFTAMLVFDLSGSMRSHINGIVKSANSFVGQLRNDDRVVVATFADKPRLSIVVEPATKRDFSQPVELNTTRDMGYTATFDAVDAAMKYMKKLRGRRAIIIFTDGELYGLHASDQENIRAAAEQDAAIYTIRFGDFPKVDPRSLNAGILIKTDKLPEKEKRRRAERSDAYLDSLTKSSGGRGFRLTEIEDLPTTFKSIANELSQQYYLGYYVKSTSNLRPKKLRVSVKKPGLVVRSREKYSAGR